MSEAESANNGVYFLSLELENIRCFKKQKLDLSNGEDNYAKWTVILGNNGIGKTTLLESFMLEPISEYESFIRKDQSNGKITRYYNDSNEFYFILKPDFEIYKARSKDSLPPFFPRDNNLRNIYAYSATRQLTDIKNNHYLGHIKSCDTALINAEEWLLETDYIANKESVIKEKYRNRLRIIKETLILLIPDVTDILISDPTERQPNPRVMFKTDNGWLYIFQLSLGYQSMIAWVVDLAARLFKAYPDSENPIADPAVVLIDEIDLHLHPKWQREIMRYLSERFTNTQFIVTAHSPLIVQAAEDENANIVVLRREEGSDEVIIDQQPKAIHGWRVDQLLASDLFGLEGSRSLKSEERLKERDEILNKPELTETDKKRLEELRYIPMAESPEDIEAMSIIREAAKLLKEKYK